MIPVVLALLVALLVILVVILTVKYFTKSTVQITFSVRDKPGSLAEALQVFKEHGVNILGLNIHLHNTKIDQDAEKNGYKLYYVHCKCTKEDKKFLKDTLNADFEEGNISCFNTPTCR